VFQPTLAFMMVNFMRARSSVAERTAHNRKNEANLPNLVNDFVNDLATRNWQLALEAFIRSRKADISPNTIKDYRGHLSRALPKLGLTPSTKDIDNYIFNLSCSIGGKFDYFKNLSGFYNWLYSPASGYGLENKINPIKWAHKPSRPSLILPYQEPDDWNKLLEAVEKNELELRNKAILSVFPESGLRLFELVGIKKQDIVWFKDNSYLAKSLGVIDVEGSPLKGVIRVKGKGNKEAYAPLGTMSEKYLKNYLAAKQLEPGDAIWSDEKNRPLGRWAFTSFLQRLENRSLTLYGRKIKANPHSFRRTFAIWLRDAGIDMLAIKDMGRWSSVAMVERYTKARESAKSFKFYKLPSMIT
jgi:site-specific recombinase XerD